MTRATDTTGPEEDDAEDLRSRTDARKERLATEEALMKLSETLVSLGDAPLGKLALSEELMHVIRGAQAVRAGAARNRAVRLVRATLRGEDFAAIRQRLGAVHGKGVSAARQRQRGRD